MWVCWWQEVLIDAQAVVELDNFSIVKLFVVVRDTEWWKLFSLLKNHLPSLLRAHNLPPKILDRIWYMHDGAPAHFRNIVRDFLDIISRGRWISHGCTIAWPPRSLDFNPLDYWGFLRSKIYKEKKFNRADCFAATQQAFAEVTPDQMQNSTRQIVRRVNLCIQEQGAPIEQSMQ